MNNLKYIWINLIFKIRRCRWIVREIVKLLLLDSVKCWNIIKEFLRGVGNNYGKETYNEKGTYKLTILPK